MPNLFGHADFTWARELILSNTRTIFPEYRNPGSFSLDVVIASDLELSDDHTGLIDATYAAVVARNVDVKKSDRLELLERSDQHLKIEVMMNDLICKTGRVVHQRLQKAIADAHMRFLETEFPTF